MMTKIHEKYISYKSQYHMGSRNRLSDSNGPCRHSQLPNAGILRGLLVSGLIETILSSKVTRSRPVQDTVTPTTLGSCSWIRVMDGAVGQRPKLKVL